MIAELISNAFGAVKEYFGWAREKANRENEPEMKQNADGKSVAQVEDEARKAVAKGDTDDIRRKLS
jgi:hypothetical protein